MKDGRNALSNAVMAIILVLVVIGVMGAHLKISELKEQVAELKTENENLKNENAKLSTETKNNRAMIDVLTVNASAASDKIKRLEKTIAGLKKSAVKQNKELAEAFNYIGVEIAALKNNLETIKQNGENFKNETYENLGLIVAKMNEIIDGVNDSSKRIENLEKTIAEMKNKTAELEKKLNKKRTCPLPPWKKNKE